MRSLLPKRKLNVLSTLFSISLLTSCGVVNEEKEDDFSNYKPAPGTVVKVIEPVMNKEVLASYIYKVEYVPEGSAQPVKADGYFLLKAYKVGDTLTVYYDPQNPGEEVVDKK